jgi:hypothetical protein
MYIEKLFQQPGGRIKVVTAAILVRPQGFSRYGVTVSAWLPFFAATDIGKSPGGNCGQNYLF